MELDITTFFNTECPRDYSASVAEIGNDAGPATWQAALEAIEDYGFVTHANVETVREHFVAMGGWTSEEIATYTHNELCAMLIQDISGTMRDYCTDVSEWDWTEYEAGCEAGTYSGRLFQSEDGCVFFVLGE